MRSANFGGVEVESAAKSKRGGEGQFLDELRTIDGEATVERKPEQRSARGGRGRTEVAGSASLRGRWPHDGAAEAESEGGFGDSSQGFPGGSCSHPEAARCGVISPPCICRVCLKFECMNTF